MMLIKKAARAMWSNKRAYVACIFLLSAGVMFYVAMNVTSVDLVTSRDAYFRDYRLADVFAEVGAAGASAAARLNKLPGVADSSVRRVADCRVVLPDSDKIITLRVISYDPGAANPINGASLSGSFNADNDLFVAQSFLDAHGLSPGGGLDLLLAGRQIRFNIAGSAATPEYAYTISSSSDYMPDPAKFNYAFAAVKPLNNYLGTPNVFNSIGIELENGYSFDDVAEPLRDELRKYGLTALYKVDDQPSTLYINMEVDAITTMSSVIPFVFCGMAVIILYLMLKRVIEQDRAQIGTLKAFGFSGAQITGHYVFYGAATGGLGALIGSILGYVISGFISSVMRLFFNLPEVRSAVDTLPIIFTGMFTGLASGMLGAFMGAFRVIGLQPAEAMKPEAPRVTKFDPLRFVPGARHFLTSSGSMAIRNITRSKFRSLFIVMSVSASFGILVFFGSFPTIIDSMMFAQYTKSEVYDIKVSFRSPRAAAAAVEEARRMGGVTRAEALLEVPVELSNNDRAKGVQLVGIPADSELYLIYDEKISKTLTPPPGGVLLSDSLAKSLNVRPGGKLTVKSPYLSADIELVVTGLVTRSMGGAFVERAALAEAFNMKGLSTSVILRADNMAAVKEALKEGANIASVVDSAENVAGLNLYMSMVDSVLVTYFAYGVLIAFAIIYNTAAIAFSERRREFATLRVLGMTVPEIGAIQSFEYWTLSAAGILIGIPYANIIKQTLDTMIEMEAFSIPAYTTTREYMIGLFGCLAAVFLSNRVSRRKILKLDMVESLKDRE